MRLAATILVCAVCTAAEPANLLANGAFEQRDGAGLPAGWSGANPGSTDVAAGNRFAVLVRTEGGKAAELAQTIALPAGAKALAVAARLRGRGIVPGKAGHERAQVFLTFLDAEGKACGYGGVQGISGTRTAWTPTAALVPVAAKAAAVRLAVGLLGGTVGTLEADDVSLAVDAPLPAPELDPAKPLALPAALWPSGDAACRLEPERDPTALVFAADSPGNRSAERWIRLPAGVPKVRIAAELRAERLQLGKEPSWQTARIMLTFHDAAGAFVPPYGAVPELREDSAEWKPIAVVREVPSGAAYLKLSPGLHHCTGSAAFRGITVSAEPAKP